MIRWRVVTVTRVLFLRSTLLKTCHTMKTVSRLTSY
ncbi:Uncharacterised protein [Vibrio cholerae]|nr:Uncharacterised protein [Vibrio cholerae]